MEKLERKLLQAEKYMKGYPYGPASIPGCVIATDGHTLVAYGAKTRPDMIDALLRVSGPRTPDFRGLASCLRDLRVVSEAVAGVDTEPDPYARADWLKRQPTVVERLKEVYARAKRGDKRGPLERLRDAEKSLRDLDCPDAHAFFAGGSAFDLRLLRKMAKFMGVKTFTLHIGEDAAEGPALVETAKGWGVIMPFRYTRPVAKAC